MTRPSREIEFKFGVDGKQDFHRLVQQLDLPAYLLDHGVKQTNHFFDSNSLCLRTNHLAVRLREEDACHFLTIKGGQQSKADADSVLTDRVEEEVTLSQETALALLSEKLSPVEVIRQQFESKSRSIVQLVNAACGDEKLKPIGRFHNIRIHLPPVVLPAGGSDEAIVFELDTSTFPDGRTDYEFEIEISESSDAVAIKNALLGLFEQAGIDWHTAPSKAERFYAALNQ
jgi:uncharacterized protein YjbK